MRILIVHTKYQHQGGEDTVVEQEFNLLKEQYTVDTLFFQNQGSIKGALQFFLSVWNIFASHKLRKKIKAFQPDVIHVHNWHFASGPIIFRVAKGMHVPVIHTLHNYRLLCPSALLLHNNEIFKDSIIQNFPWKAVQNKVYRNSYFQTFWLGFVVWFHKKIGTWKKVDKYICLTPFATVLFQNSTFGVGANQFTIKPNFTYLTKYINKVNRYEHFLFIGRLSEEKGINKLLLAFENSKFKLKIAGSGPLENLVRESCQNNQNIEFIGNIGNESVLNELRKCSCLIFPSICYEGMSLILIESFACSTPVIASNLGSMSTMIVHGENGLHFAPNNLTDLKDKIHQWNSFSDKQKEPFYANAFSHFNRIYSSEKQMDYFNKIYQDVLHK